MLLKTGTSPALAGRLPLLLVSVLWLIACSPEHPTATSKQIDEATPALILTVMSPQQAQIRRFPAQVQAAEEAALAFRVPGELVALPARAGQAVKSGEVLARLDPTDYQLRVDDRNARFQLASTQFERINDLFKQKQVSKAQYDQAKAEMDIALTALNSARSDLGYTVLKAPFDGTVAGVYGDNHQAVAAGATLLTLQVRELLEIRVQVPEQLMAHMSDSSRPYQPEVEFDALPGQRFKLAYKSHNTQADPATGSYQIELTLPRPASLNLLPGMSAMVYADLGQVMDLGLSHPIIPAQAVFQTATQPQGDNVASVWVVDSSFQISARTVKTGKLSSAGLEIISGLEAGEQILGAGVHYAREGMLVRSWSRERGL